MDAARPGRLRCAILATWLDLLSEGVIHEVSHGLARAGLSRPVEDQLAGRRRSAGPVDEIDFSTSATELRSRMLAWSNEPDRRPDLRTCLLAALTGLLGISSSGPSDPRVVHERFRAASDLLPSPLRELLTLAGTRQM